MTNTQKREIKTHLIKGLDTLSQLGETSLAVENCPDETDLAVQLSQLGLNMAMFRRRAARMTELEHALKRLNETDYGRCDECDEEIGVARLKANPTARLCVSCQSAIEDGLTN